MSDERGTAVVSFVIVVSVLFLFIELTLAAGRVASIQSAVESSAREAARVATIAQHQDNAEDRARDSVENFFANREDLCALDKDADVTVTMPNGWRPGGRVEVEVQCTVPLDYFVFLKIPGDQTMTLAKSAAEPIDYYRSVGS